MTPKPGTEGFNPDVHCGLPVHEQDQYDAEVRDALSEIDAVFRNLGITFPDNVTNMWEANAADSTTEG